MDCCPKFKYCLISSWGVSSTTGSGTGSYFPGLAPFDIHTRFLMRGVIMLRRQAALLIM